MAGHFREARAELIVCAKPACPKFIASDCTGWLAEVEAELPTVVFAAIDENGRDLVDAEVRVDGELVTNATDGLAHAFDPGAHVVEIRAGVRVAEEKLTLRTGEKARRVELRFAHARSPFEVVLSPVPVSAFAFGGLALAFGATSAVMWAVGASDANAYNARCDAGPCSSGDRASVLRELVVGDVSIGLALVSATIATVVVLTRKTTRTPLAAMITF